MDTPEEMDDFERLHDLVTEMDDIKGLLDVMTGLAAEALTRAAGAAVECAVTLAGRRLRSSSIPVSGLRRRRDVVDRSPRSGRGFCLGRHSW
ncbi:hypothetical protein A5N17_13795 [Arthrobacter sp. D2]|uniref:Uncharacterized protein n=1 Tax=Arthrobacter sp. J3.40 TaxID=347209 RepID=I3W1E3_9MICC|nr:hypothetical protein [Arthrobacter sp. J3.40]NKR10569.1 hypothetical protein [Arthrobacter sp. M5]NKR15195.1 hypothetical protein [Arthrobacter sp. M6]OEH61574.1 hypothetical protein A5N17_13795 [Arthrobacter sp. D2]OEH61633.1 hypothetical protein A5N13_16215 [Arthrobacter sp. D4]